MAMTVTGDSHEAVPAGSNRFLVPRSPGRLRPLDHRPGESRDEVDELVYELFGDPIEDSPGRLDAVLLIVGGLIIGWGLLTAQSAGVLVLGVVILVLGLALPLRTARRAVRGRRTSREQQRLLAHGIVLDATHPAVHELAESYEELAWTAELAGLRQAPQALEAGHLAMTEVASLLEARAPVVEAEVEYVGKRTRAIRDLTSELHQAHERHVQSRDARLAEQVQPLRLRAAAVAAARDELDAMNPADSLDEIERLTGELRKENRDGDT
jgi:hypothetical protein